MAQLLVVRRPEYMYRFSSAYQRAWRWALVCQFAGVLLTFLFVAGDFGRFAFRFLCLSLVFWILASVLMIARQQPTILERIFIGSGPIVVYLIMIIFG